MIHQYLQSAGSVKSGLHSLLGRTARKRESRYPSPTPLNPCQERSESYNRVPYLSENFWMEIVHISVPLDKISLRIVSETTLSPCHEDCSRAQLLCAINGSSPSFVPKPISDLTFWEMRSEGTTRQKTQLSSIARLLKRSETHLFCILSPCVML